MAASATRKAAPNSRSKHLAVYRWKPGQSGNPKGREPGSRNKLSEDFFRDLSDAWKAFGKPALMATAWTEPAKFVSVVASLMPRDVKVDVTHAIVDQLTDEQLASHHPGLGHRDAAQAAEDPEILQ
jgi:hypothetical protein